VNVLSIYRRRYQYATICLGPRRTHRRMVSKHKRSSITMGRRSSVLPSVHNAHGMLFVS
jgi:hypothetical protein